MRHHWRLILPRFLRVFPGSFCPWLSAENVRTPDALVTGSPFEFVDPLLAGTVEPQTEGVFYLSPA